MHEAIDSALMQSYPNIEIIVVNDGSNDNGKTEQIALSYGKKIKYFSKENGGVASALNLAIEQMEGVYFSWLSHDDVYYPQKIQEQIEYLKFDSDEHTIVYCDFDIIDSKSEIITKRVFDHNMLIKKPLYGILRGYIHGCSLLIPKEAFNQYGLFNTNLKFTQDYDLWLKFSKYYNFKHIEKTLIQSRSHHEQDSKKHSIDPKEGNAFWSKCVEELEDNVILQCEKTKVLFYLKMALHLKGTPYKEGYNRSKELAYAEAPLFTFLFLQYSFIGFYSKRIGLFFINRFKRVITKIF